MSFAEKSCSEFTGVLASRAPVPGGGGASALVGAVGAALGLMVCNLTVGKQKYIDVQRDICAIIDKMEELRGSLLHLIDADAESFAPLAAAYGIPKDEPGRADVMENALRQACGVPLEIMRVCCRAISLHGELAEKGSALALSDVGVGVICCKSALMGASLNVFINTKSMRDRAYAAGVEAEAQTMLDTYCPAADGIYARVLARLR